MSRAANIIPRRRRSPQRRSWFLVRSTLSCPMSVFVRHRSCLRKSCGFSCFAPFQWWACMVASMFIPIVASFPCTRLPDAYFSRVRESIEPASLKHGFVRQSRRSTSDNDTDSFRRDPVVSMLVLACSSYAYGVARQFRLKGPGDVKRAGYLSFSSFMVGLLFFIPVSFCCRSRPSAGRTPSS